jgi:nitroreductase
MINGDELMDLFHTRQSDRAYNDKPVPRMLIERCIEASRLAPSACNSQPWKFVVVDDPALKNKIADATANRLLPLNHFTKQAPVHVVVVRENANLTSNLGSTIKDKKYPLIDIGIATEHFCLQAAAEGLGTCILGWFDERAVKKLLGIPGNRRVELIITLGYPSGSTREKRRKSLEEILRYNTYTNNRY